MTELPRITVAQHDGLWVASCDRCSFVFRHIYRHVTDEQAIQHRSRGHARKAGNRAW